MLRLPLILPMLGTGGTKAGSPTSKAANPAIYLSNMLGILLIYLTLYDLEQLPSLSVPHYFFLHMCVNCEGLGSLSC